MVSSVKKLFGDQISVWQMRREGLILIKRSEITNPTSPFLSSNFYNATIQPSPPPQNSTVHHGLLFSWCVLFGLEKEGSYIALFPFSFPTLNFP